MLVDFYSPVELRSYEIMKSKHKDLVYCAVSFLNLSEKTLSSVEFSLFCYDSFGQPVGGEPPTNEVRATFQDKQVVSGKNFGEEELVPLSDHPTTRSVEVIVNKVAFADGSIWEKGDYELIDLQTAKLSGQEQEDLKKVAGAEAVCYAREEDDFWQCACGRGNLPDAESCIRCGLEKEFVIQLCSSKEKVSEELERRRREEEEEKERELQEKRMKEEEENKIRKQKGFKALKFIIPSVIVIILAWAVITYLLIPPIAYDNAIAFMEEEDYSAALEAFSRADGYKDSEKVIQDIVSRYSTVVSANEIHTVGLQSSGNAVAVGDNRYGECDVESWDDLIAVSTGNLHTVGLQSDGTAMAVGSNFSGECEVDDWDGILSVSAGLGHTVGLRSDGTAVAVGDNIHGQCEVEGWNDLIAISGGSTHTVGLKEDGTVVAVGVKSYGRCDVENWENIVSVSAGGRHTVGLKSDGTAVAVGDNEHGQSEVDDWNDLITVSAGHYHTVGLKSDGTAVAVGDNEYGQCEVEGWANIGPNK